MKIATYNVNGINGRLPVLLRWLAEAAPEIVCLQELKAPDEKFPVSAIEAAGYEVIWHGQKSWNGVAILSRVGTPVETRRGLPDDPEAMGSTDFKDLDETPEMVTKTAKMLASNAVHLAGLLKRETYPG